VISGSHSRVAACAASGSLSTNAHPAPSGAACHAAEQWKMPAVCLATFVVSCIQNVTDKSLWPWISVNDGITGVETCTPRALLPSMAN
jgi:hypothetical protein